MTTDRGTATTTDNGDDTAEGIVEGTTPRWLRWLERIVGALLLAVALWVVGRELRAVNAIDVARAAGSVARWQLGLAVAATVLNYAIMTGYDHLALRQLGVTLSAMRISVAGFVAFAIVNSLGFALITGPWARLRFYARWGVDLTILPHVVAFNAVTVWTGLFALLGAVLIVNPETLLAAWAPLPVWRALGAVMLGTVALYVYLAATMRDPIRVGRWTLHMPSARLAVSQVVLSSTDWLLVAGVLWLLMPEGTVPFRTLLGAFLTAQMIGLLSHVPGSLGVLEGTMLTLLRGDMPAPVLLAGLMLFRIVFYLSPLVVALVVVTGSAWPKAGRRARQHPL